MKWFLSLVKAVCGKIFDNFVRNRFLAELPSADELIQRRRDHHSDDPRADGGLPIIGVF